MMDAKPNLGKGFQRKQQSVAKKMQVDPNEIQQMQRGYETRIARQRDIIERLQEALAMRTQDVQQHMERANEAAGLMRNDMAPVLETASVAGSPHAVSKNPLPFELYELLKLIPADWDLYNEDDTPLSIITGYILWCEDQVSNQKHKQESLVKNYQQPVDRLITALGYRGLSQTMRGMSIDEIVMRIIDDLERDKRQSNLDAKVLAEMTNKNLAEMPTGDDTPPWEQEEPKAFVQPATVGSSSIMNDEFMPGATETLDWKGAGDLPPGEERPSRSF